MKVNRVAGMMIIDVTMANPNGDPDWDNKPRQTNAGYGLISPVSIKRKIRDIFEDHDSPCFAEFCELLKINPERYWIFESKNRGYDNLSQNDAMKKAVDLAKENPEEFFSRYYDARLLGVMALGAGDSKIKPKSKTADKKKTEDDQVKENKPRTTTTGCLTISPAVSISRIDIIEKTMTKKAPLENDKEQGMAPNAFKAVEHGLYVATFTINPSMMPKSFATKEDVDVFKRVLPYIFQLSSANARPSSSVSMAHLWWREHENSIGSFNEFEWFRSLMPVRKDDLTSPSKDISDYVIPDGKKLGAVDLVCK